MNHSGALRRKSGITVHDFLSERKAEEHGDPPAETREDNPPEAEQAVPPTKIARSARKAPKKKTACEISSRSPAAVPAPTPTIGRSPSKILMDEIGTFLTGNDLDITPANLARAHAICSGEQPEFAALTAAMKDRGEPITQQWLDTLAYDDGRNEQDRAEVDRMASNLQNSIEAFATNARDACTAVADYREAMNSHAQEAEEIDSQETAEELLGRVTELTRAIREQAQLAEEKMQRSEREAISLRRDLEEAQRVANIDHLTGLPNRRALDEMLERLWSDARDVDWDGSDEKEREPVAIAFCDIDNFKPVNDIHGHDTGDRVLQMVARTLAERGRRGLPGRALWRRGIRRRLSRLLARGSARKSRRDPHEAVQPALHQPDDPPVARHDHLFRRDRGPFRVSGPPQRTARRGRGLVSRQE